MFGGLYASWPSASIFFLGGGASCLVGFTPLGPHHLFIIIIILGSLTGREGFGGAAAEMAK